MSEQNEVTRLCSHCQGRVTRADEVRGECPHCHGRLLILSGRWGAWDNDTLESLAALGDLDLAADELEAEAGDVRTDEEKDADDRRDYLEWLHGRPDRPAEFDDSPIADPDDPGPACGNPDDFCGSGERHSDVW